jgi:hypothetical protein
MSNNTIDELRTIADEAEREAQAALRARTVAVVRSSEALKKAAKARTKLMRALGAQGEGG